MGDESGVLPDSDTWCSPPEICDPLEDFFSGPVDLDPCSNASSIVLARHAFRTGGLIKSWRLPGSRPSTVYQNEPYSQAAVWTDKGLREFANGNVRELVRLTMMSTSTSWWQQLCEFRFCNPRILALGRIKFINPLTRKQGMTCRFEPALICFATQRRKQLFAKKFAHLARWSTWGR